MNYVITGSLGHISKPITEALVAAGHQVTVLTSNQDRVQEIDGLGAQAKVGSLEDADFVSSSFKDADALYLMIPPNFTAPSLFEFQKRVADNFANAIKSHQTRHAVVLSSIGAHIGNATGPIDGVAYMEKQLSVIEGLNVKFLRPSYFYYNLLSLIPLLKQANILGANFGTDKEKIALTHTSDIADIAKEELLNLSFTGKSHRYIASDEVFASDVAAQLGASVNKSRTPWIMFSDEEQKSGMLQAGLPEDRAEMYTVMGKSIREGKLQADYWKHKSTELGKVKLSSFAKEFAAAYNS